MPKGVYKRKKNKITPSKDHPWRLADTAAIDRDKERKRKRLKKGRINYKP